MSLAISYAAHCPFILESDSLSLSSGFLLQGDTLHDSAVRASHQFRSPGEHIVELLQHGVLAKDLYQCGTSYGLSGSQVNEVLGLLNITGGLRLKRNVRMQCTAVFSRLTHLTLHVRYAPLTWRRSITLITLALGIFRSTTLVTVTSLLVCLLIASAGLLPILITYITSVFGLFLFLSSLYVHEIAHSIIIRKNGYEPIILQRGLRLGLIHPRMKPGAEIMSSIAGPISGLTYCWCISLVCLATGHWHLALLGVIVATFHLSGLLPWYGDGASLRNAMRSMRS